MLGLGLGANKLKRLSAFNPSNIGGLQLWLDATDESTLNAKMAADFVAANFEYLSSASTDFNKGDEDFSFGGWVKQKTFVTNAGVVGKFSTTSNQRSYTIITQESGGFRLIISSNGIDSISINLTGFTLTEWNFVVAVYDSVNDLLKFSVNGAIFTTTAHSGGAFSSTTDFQLGIQTAGYLNGQIDGAFFYDKALTQDQVTSLYNSGNGKAYADLTADDLTSLVSWWQLNETSGTRVDAHGANDLTDNNTVGYALGKIQEPISNGENVWRWTDKSANVYLLQQDTATAQPKWISAGFGTKSKAHVLFDGVSSFLEATGLTLNQSITLFIAAQSNGNSETFFDGNDATNTVKISKTATNYNLNAGSSLNGDANSTSNVLITVIISGASSSIQINNAAAIAGNAGANVLDAIRLGVNNAGAEFLDGKMTEVIAYDSVLSASQITKSQNYLNSKYGIY